MNVCVCVGMCWCVCAYLFLHCAHTIGITIDFLNRVEYHTGASFHYYFPCRRVEYRLTGRCNGAYVRMANESIAMLASGASDEESDYIGGGRKLCGSTNKCLSAGAHKISEGLLTHHHLTQPVMMTGYRVATLAVPVAPTTFDWASPFNYRVWLVIALEIFVCGVAIFVAEYQADNTALGTTILIYWTLFAHMQITPQENLRIYLHTACQRC